MLAAKATLKADHTLLRAQLGGDKDENIREFSTSNIVSR